MRVYVCDIDVVVDINTSLLHQYRMYTCMCANRHENSDAGEFGCPLPPSIGSS